MLKDLEQVQAEEDNLSLHKAKPMYFAICPSIYLASYFYLAICLSVCLSIYLSIRPCMHLPMSISIYVSIYPSTYLPVYESIYRLTHQSIYVTESIYNRLDVGIYRGCWSHVKTREAQKIRATQPSLDNAVPENILE